MANYNKPTVGFHTNPERINKNGRPVRDWTWAGLIEKEAEKKIKGMERKNRVVKAVYKKAESGDIQAFRELSNRTDGLPKGTNPFEGASGAILMWKNDEKPTENNNDTVSAKELGEGDAPDNKKMDGTDTPPEGR